ncbi:LemA family protein [Natranaerofaba carboxydovora]|uniref:LemA family protein n=1 Tax=Natranaerofaba carboxydovora TaxID=2742683 RepID=UPI001F146D61|nr:LemA family protein [Natranaerofaba carboxydovora]UMZ74811.1 LemA family protein [Natranaerofaba carboxydovora]
MIIALVVLGVIILYVVVLYNGLISKKNNVDRAWSDIDTHLQKRYDLVPNLVNTVKGYMKHEQEVLENITQARTKWMNSSTLKDKEAAENQMAGALKSLFAVSENYPELKANENFKLLQEDLTAIENKLAYARQRYNRTVKAFNTAIQKFPAVIFANMLNFEQQEYFEVETEEARRPVEVNFDE